MSKTKPRQKSHFFKTYLKEKKQIGAWVPSSKFLVRKMCQYIPFDDSKVIVELGPGTGVFTKEILKQAKPDARIFLFELNPDFFELLQKQFNDPRLTIINASAEQLKNELNRYGIEKVDAILSSLPLAIIPENVSDSILKNVYQILKPNGVFTQYQYTLNAKKSIENLFGKIKIAFSAINIPPAFIYVAIK